MEYDVSVTVFLRENTIRTLNDWNDVNCQGRYRFVMFQISPESRVNKTKIVYNFQYEVDAMAFKLRWM